MGQDTLHATLRRQLRRMDLTDSAPPTDPAQWRALLASIDRAYREADELVYLVSNAERIITDELAQSQQALAVAQRLAGLGSWTYEPASGDVIVSEELAHLLELDVGRLKMSIERMLDFIVPADRPTATELLRDALAAQRNRTGEIRFLTAGGLERWCLCRIASHVNAAGEVVRLDGTVLDISERRAAEERTRQLARTDPLTGLANRAHFFQLLTGAIAQTASTQGRAAVVFIDLDGFKAVNDTCGHPVGDALLETIAGRLRGCLRGSDSVARFGGDEFVLLLRHVGNDQELDRVCQKILAACATSVPHDGETLGVSASVGVALYPNDGDTAERLVQSADAAMYVAKKSGRNNVRYFGDEARARRHADRAMVGALRNAISRHEISVAFQPIVDVQTMQVIGAEALARWNHPQLGPVSPADFIVLAEENGLIGELSNVVLHAACAEMEHLESAVRRRRTISVNISPVQLRSADFVDKLQGVLAQYGVDPDRLRIEVTESAMMGDREMAVRTLQRLRELGMTIWLDDFGTGQSSLAWLRQLPVDGIKIDRSFVGDIEGGQVGAILSSVISMARSLGCELVAEGVETRQQRDALLAAGCRMMQGYLFGRPDVFERWRPTRPAELAA